MDPISTLIIPQEIPIRPSYKSGTNVTLTNLNKTIVALWGLWSPSFLTPPLSSSVESCTSYSTAASFKECTVDTVILRISAPEFWNWLVGARCQFLICKPHWKQFITQQLLLKVCQSNSPNVLKFKQFLSFLPAFYLMSVSCLCFACQL